MAATAETKGAESFEFRAEVNQVLSLVINSLYSHPEIFLRELISNASDALDKLRYRSLTDEKLRSDAPQEIRLLPDDQAGTLTVEDFGVGMTREQLVEELGTIAHSGTRAFMNALKEAKDKPGEVDLIGQFGVGFYSAFLVADRVEVVTRAAGSDEAWRWTSSASGGFTVEPAEREVHGTAITLHLKDDAKDFVHGWRLKDLVRKWSDYVSFPIKLEEERLEGEGDDQEVVKELTQINSATALWRRPSSEITGEEYEEFYRHLTRDWQDPLTRLHFKVEGMQQFTGLLFVPSKAPFDLYTTQARRGVRLYVKRVFIMDDVEELLPQWLRFVRGLVDSDDLPLNVSREILQDSAVTRVIRKQIVKKSLDMLDELAEDADKYATFWEQFGPVLKEGLHMASGQRDRIGKLVRYRSSKSGGEWTSLEAYVERMPEDQEAVYYVIAGSEQAAASSPHLEALRKRGYEVLYMTDPIDEWAVKGLDEIELLGGKSLVSAMHADLDLDAEDEETAKQKEERKGELKSLLDRVEEVLGDRVSEVRLSSRLTDSPACLVVPEGGVHAQWEQLMKQAGQAMAAPKRIFELNPTHPVVEALRKTHEADADSADVGEWVELLYDQALLTEGSAVEDPNAFARRVTRLMERALV